MSSEDLDKVIQEFRRRQKNRRVVFVLLVTGTLAVVVVALAYLSYHAKQAENAAAQQKSQADIATVRIGALAQGIFQKVQETDTKASGLSSGKNPTVYIWQSGLHPSKAQQPHIDPMLIQVLVDRRSLLIGAGPALGPASNLKDYVCDHIWHVVGESALEAEAAVYLRTQAEKDLRFELAQVGTIGRKPGWLPIIVAFFLTRQEAEDLAKEINVGDFQIRVWNFGEYRPDCPGIKNLN